jgi:hypothetical protein
MREGSHRRPTACANSASQIAAHCATHRAPHVQHESWAAEWLQMQRKVLDKEVAQGRSASAIQTEAPRRGRLRISVNTEIRFVGEAVSVLTYCAEDGGRGWCRECLHGVSELLFVGCRDRRVGPTIGEYRVCRIPVGGHAVGGWVAMQRKRSSQKLAVWQGQGAEKVHATTTRCELAFKHRSIGLL